MDLLLHIARDSDGSITARHERQKSANSAHSSIDYAWSNSALYLKDLNNGVPCRCSRDECEAGARTTFYFADEYWVVIAPG